MDMDFNYTYVSPSVEKLRGFTVEEAMSAQIDSLASPEIIEQWLGLLAEGFEREKQGMDPARSLRSHSSRASPNAGL